MRPSSPPPGEPRISPLRFADADPLLPENDVWRPAFPLPHALEVRRLEVFVFRAPIATPVITSFDVMNDRPAVLVRIEDRDGCAGWGEVWANFPSCGAEHRAHLLTRVVAPFLIGQSFAHPAQAFVALERRLRTLALQAGEWGPFAQALAGIDIALWDLAARRADKSLAQLLGGDAVSVPAYASGINLDGAPRRVEACRSEGHRAFKVKVGFGRERDLAVINEVVAGLKADEQLMLDANQAWSLDDALAMVRSLEGTGVQWLEEPIAADRPEHEWQELAEATAIPLAGGENLRGLQNFERAIESGAFGVLQPDLCKWGGISGCVAVARKVRNAGLRYCPHFLGGGIGLVASAHVLAAIGGDGLLEVDSNPNPLREALAEPFPQIHNARFPLHQTAGLGVEPDLALARQWLVHSCEVS